MCFLEALSWFTTGHEAMEDYCKLLVQGKLSLHVQIITVTNTPHPTFNGHVAVFNKRMISLYCKFGLFLIALRLCMELCG